MSADLQLVPQNESDGGRTHTSSCSSCSTTDPGHGNSEIRRSSFRFALKTSLPVPARKMKKSSIFESTSEEEKGYDASIDVLCDDTPRKIRKCASGSWKEKGAACAEISEASFYNRESIDSQELDDIALSVLGTIPHPSAPGNSACVSYFQQVLKIPDNRMKRLCRQAEKKENTVLQLICHVKGATQLQLKDTKVLPDIVCHLTVASRDKQMDASFRSHNMLEWHQNGWVREVKMTKFATATLSPVWRETFNFVLSNPAEEMIVIEIWGKKRKDTPSQTTHKEYYQKHKSFIGRAFYVLKTTPIEGEERTLTLFSHSGKHERGKVMLQLSIKGQREDNPIEVSLREHSILQKMIVDHESQESGVYIQSWDTKITTTAETILKKHAELAGMSRFQEISIRLNVTLEYHKFNKVKLSTIASLLEEMVMLDTNPDPKHLWVRQLLFDMHSLHSLMLELVKGHLVHFNIKASSDIDEIASCVRILKALYSFPPLVKKLKEEQRDLKMTLNICIQVAVPRWFLELSKSILVDRVASFNPAEDGEVEMLSLRGLCGHCLRHALRAQGTLNPIFAKVDCDYFTEFYITLDKLLCGEAMPRIRHFTSRLNEPIVYELYVVFKDLAKLAKHVPQSYHESLEILTFHKYFVSLPLVWIELATNKCKQKLEKAISLDESVQTGSNQARFSSSALDTEGFLLQLGLFWKNLEWPIATDAIGYLVTTIEQISQLSLHYVDALYKSLLLDYAIMYDNSGRFRSSERLCAILNNMYHTKRTLSEMPVTLELESYYDWLEDNCKQLGDKAKKLVISLLSSKDEDIDNKIVYFVDRISERLTPDICFYFEVILPTSHHKTGLSNILKSRTRSTSIAEALHWPWQNKDTEEHLTNEEAITPLLSYLTANLQILGDNLLTPVLNSILHKLWNVILSVVQGRLIMISRKQSVMYLYERLEYFVRELKVFFHADGNAMSLENLETDIYKFIINKLNLLQMSTEDLEERYLWELSEQQKYLNSYSITTGGSLEVSVGYLIDKQEVELSIIQARNLPAKAKLNTYVEVHMLPNYKGTKKAHRTSVTRGTMNPFYAEEFNLPVKSEHLTGIGTILLMLVCEQDSNDILGICVVHVTEIPQLYAHVETLQQQGGVPERKKITKALFFQKESPVLKELEARVEANDHDIVDFYKSNRRVFEKCQRRVTATKWDL